METATYTLDDGTRVRFEVDPEDGYTAASGQLAGRVREAVDPAVKAAAVVLRKVRQVGPDRIEVKFGIRVSGGSDWIIARAAGEASFEVTLAWDREEHRAEPDGAAAAAAPVAQAIGGLAGAETG
jgi:Trypsin-co-occurring domain 1